MKISIPEQSTTVESPTGPVLVRPYQIVVSVRLFAQNVLSPAFPAVLDTGHSHNFSISNAHLREWAQMTLKTSRVIRVNGLPVPVSDADLEIDGIRLRLPEGISVFPKDHPGVTRLPLIGLRALVRNGLRVIVDGSSRQVSISRRWRLW
jgi:hypothetical protein